MEQEGRFCCREAEAGGRFRAEEGCDRAQGHAPGLGDGDAGAGHGDGAQVGGAGEVAEVEAHDFPAPDGAIGAETGAVESKADGGGGEAVLGEAAGNVGVVVLDADEGQIVAGGELLRPGGGEVLGVEVVGDGGGRDLKGGLEMGQGELSAIMGDRKCEKSASVR